MNKKITYFTILVSFSILAYFLAQSHYHESLPPKPRIVYVDMIADLFHAGHVNFLKQACQHGDYLIVGICSDEVSTNYKRRPILTMDERIQEVSACRYVDQVIPNAPLSLTKEYLDKHNIDLVIHGDDYSAEQEEAYYGPAIAEGKFRTVPYTKGVSTSEIISRIRSRSDEELAKKHAKTAAPAA